jgi:hypothetical protein
VDDVPYALDDLPPGLRIIIDRMGLKLVNLDPDTRSHVLAELEHDLEMDNLYSGKYLSDAGSLTYPGLLRKSIESGTDDSLAITLQAPGLFLEVYERRNPRGGVTLAKVPYTAAETLAQGEFNRFYLRGLCRRVLASGGGKIEIYRARESANPRPESEAMIGGCLMRQRCLPISVPVSASTRPLVYRQASTRDSAADSLPERWPILGRQQAPECQRSVCSNRCLCGYAAPRVTSEAARTVTRASLAGHTCEKPSSASSSTGQI